MRRRGDVVIVQFPYTTGSRGKNRPAVVIQDDRNNARLQNTIVAMITGNTSLASSEPTQVRAFRLAAPPDCSILPPLKPRICSRSTNAMSLGPSVDYRTN